jgi:hypothetical protein
MFHSFMTVKRSALGVLALLIVPGLTFGNGLIYGTIPGSVSSIDPTTGAVSTVASQGFTALTFGNGLIYGTIPGSVSSIDPTTGAVSTVASQGFNRLAINPVPIPPAVWLFGSALGLMGVMRRKANV